MSSFSLNSSWNRGIFKNSLKFWALTKRGVKIKKQKINKDQVLLIFFQNTFFSKNIVKPIFPQSQWTKRKQG
jgi:hypothetical protein